MHLMMLILALHGQTVSATSGSPSDFMVAPLPLIETIDPDEYIVGPGDVFWFSVQGGLPPELTGIVGSSFAYLTVTPDGYIVVPTVGSYFVSDRTLAEAALLIEAGFSSRFPGIRADAGLVGVRSYLITVTGQVRTPGLVEILGSDRLTDALAAAGGIDQTGSLTRIQILHRDGDTTLVDLTGFLLDGNRACNPVLRMGDRLVVSTAEQFVVMEGAFQVNPFCVVSTVPATELTPWVGSLSGRLEYIPGEGVHRFVNRVGGTAAWADRDACYIVRMNPDSITVSIPAPLDDPSTDPVLLPGDRVICPGTPPLVAVSGVVTTPGVYPHMAGMDTFYYVSLAGGFTHESYQGGTRVILPDGSVLEPEDLFEVPAGATITVPRKVLVWWQDPLLIATSIATVIIAWKSVY